MGPRYQLAMRRLAKAGIAHALQRTGADALLDALAGARGLPVVLGYHNVVEDAGAYGTWTGWGADSGSCRWTNWGSGC